MIGQPRVHLRSSVAILSNSLSLLRGMTGAFTFQWKHTTALLGQMCPYNSMHVVSSVIPIIKRVLIPTMLYEWIRVRNRNPLAKGRFLSNATFIIVPLLSLRTCTSQRLIHILFRPDRIDSLLLSSLLPQVANALLPLLTSCGCYHI